jgi:hypothetical protein
MEVWMHEKSSADQRSETSQGQRETRECRSSYDMDYVLEDVADCAESGELAEENAPYGNCKGAAGEASYLVYWRVG